MDSLGRVFVADRGNNRIQIFSPDGELLYIWTQFGKPSGLFIDRNDMLYASDGPESKRWIARRILQLLSEQSAFKKLMV